MDTCFAGNVSSQISQLWVTASEAAPDSNLIGPFGGYAAGRAVVGDRVSASAVPYKKQVLYGRTFPSIPTIRLSITGMNWADPTKEVRVKVWATNATVSDFLLNVAVWGDSVSTYLEVDWWVTS